MYYTRPFNTFLTVHFIYPLFLNARHSIRTQYIYHNQGIRKHFMNTGVVVFCVILYIVYKTSSSFWKTPNRLNNIENVLPSPFVI